MTTDDATPSRRRRVLLGAALLAVVLAVVLVGIFLIREPGEESSGASDGGTSAAASDGGGAAETADDEPAEGDDDATPAQPTAVEAPEPGQTEPIEKPPTTAEVAFDESAGVTDDLVVEVVSVEAVEAGRDIPGETAGPAVKVVISIENRGADAVDTSGVSVNLSYGGDSQIPAPEVIDDASSVFPASIPAGGTGEGTFLFAVPLDSAGNVRIMIDVLAAEPDVVFSGPRPG